MKSFQGMRLALSVFACAAIVVAFSATAPLVRASKPSAAPGIAANWITTGNKTGSGDFFGTTNNRPLIFKTNKVERMRLDTLGNVGIGTNAPTSKLTVAGEIQSTNGGFKFPDGTTQTTASVAGPNGWGLGGNGGTSAGTNFVGTTDNQALAFKTNNTERIRISSGGNVGIGTTTGAHKLTIVGGPSWTNSNWTGAIELPTGSAIGWQANSADQRFGLGHSSGGFGLFRTASNPGTNTSNAIYDLLINNAGNVGIGTTIPAHRLSIIGGPAWTSAGWTGGVELSNVSAIGWQANASGTRFGIGQTNGGLFFFRTASNPGTTASPAYYSMMINDAGNVGIGTANPSATLHVQPPDLSYDTTAFKVESALGNTRFKVRANGIVEIGGLNGLSTYHVCHSTAPGGYTIQFSSCGSAAEYVPTIDGGSGFPETADLVSIAPQVQNPYGDEHGPFVVQKAATPCDNNLLGFIINPESGADGVKKNDHYLPLAIYGYFPAKVTTANGVIKRGDALTSSSKAGYAMKATGACKIIGYALEDAESDGEIQVFADLGENSATQFTELQTQVNTLTQENLALKETLAQMDARLKALEQVAPIASNAVAQAR